MEIIFLVGACILFYSLFVIPTKWLKVERNQVMLGLNKKVLQISDLHMERIRIKPKQIKAVIEKEKPDYIFLTGDYYDRPKSKEKLKEYLKIIQNSGVPSYAVLGNHDYYMEEEDRKEQALLFEEYGIHLLINEKVEFDSYTLVGLDDFCSENHDERIFEDVNMEKPIILLQHDPNYALHSNYYFDYMLCGHLHGKQFNIPFLFTLKPMGELPKKGIYKGHHTLEKGKAYISKGIGQSGFNIRLFVRSEVTIHEI